MGQAAKARLRSALEDYVSSETGDGGRGIRSAQDGPDLELVRAAQKLLGGITKQGQDAGDASTPGGRAAAGRGRDRTAGGGFDAAADRAREMLAHARNGSEASE